MESLLTALTCCPLLVSADGSQALPLFSGPGHCVRDATGTTLHSQQRGVERHRVQTFPGHHQVSGERTLPLEPSVTHVSLRTALTRTLDCDSVAMYTGVSCRVVFAMRDAAV